MSRRGKLSRDQKRKKKLAERARSDNRIEPYTGSKYKTDYYIPAVLSTETGIYESYVMSERKLTDWQVKESLEYLIRQLREEEPEPPPDNPQVEFQDGDWEDMVAASILRNWGDALQGQYRYSTEDRIGILRTLLGSIGVWSRPVPDSRGYLQFLEGFLRRAGVRVEVQPVRELNQAGPDADEEGDDTAASDAENLTELGEAWIHSRNPEAKREFMAEAEALLGEGKAGLVIETCQKLIGSALDTGLTQEMNEILQKAWKQEPPAPAQRSGGGWVPRLLRKWTRGATEE